MKDGDVVRHNKIERLTSDLGHSRPKSTIQVTSAYPLRAEVQRTSLMVRFVPILLKKSKIERRQKSRKY